MTALLQDCIQKHAQANPEDLALSMDGETWSYERLDQFTNQLARSLKRAGCRPGDRVAFILPKSPMAIASILAILKAGCIYVPVDPDSPAERAKHILVSSEPRLLLADSSNAELVGKLQSYSTTCPPVGDLSQAGTLPDGPTALDLRDVGSQPDEPVRETNSLDGAYILYTSGSTGVPKGVLITHRNVAAFVDWGIRYFRIRNYDRHSGYTPLHFDLSAFDIFGTFAAGAQLVLVPPELSLSAHRMADFIRSNELTQWFSVPSVLNYLARFDVVRHGDFPMLRRVLWCGEVLPTPVLQYWMMRLPWIQFTNLYGPTEATIASSYYTVPKAPASETEPIPIGQACDGEELLVLDGALNPVPHGQTGDLYIAGAGLSPGYWRDSEKTKSVFIEGRKRIYRTGDLAKIGDDGLVYFLGREDSQIKSRGYRIELGEIESAMNALPEVSESAVVAINSRTFENVTICCGYSPSPGSAITPAMVRQSLKDKLPSYMLPSRWLVMSRLPRNANGKIDRGRLREEFKSVRESA